MFRPGRRLARRRFGIVLHADADCDQGSWRRSENLAVRDADWQYLVVGKLAGLTPSSEGLSRLLAGLLLANEAR
jgi:hypothetical protein